MIFMTRRAFAEAVEHEVIEREFKRRIDEDLYKLQATLQKMEHRLSALEFDAGKKVWTPVNETTEVLNG